MRPMSPRRRSVRALAVALALPVLAPAGAHAQSSSCFGELDADSVEARPGPPMRFGVTPGVQTGQLGTGALPPRTPEDPAQQLSALGRLRPANGPFVLRLHRFFWSEGEAEVQRFLALAERYTSAGYLVELQLRYHPNEEQEGDIDAWVAHVRDVVRRFGANPRVVAIQVTNEVNLTFSPDSSDGAYERSRDALIQGVIAAQDEVRRRGYEQLEIGFNWAYRTDPGSEDSFWRYVRDTGGPAFARAVDWVGLDAYPGTFFPPTLSPGGERDAIVNAMSTFRCFLEFAGIPDSAPIHVEENGWPTGPGRTEERQVEVGTSMIREIDRLRGTFGVSDYRWFNLRDGNTQSGNFQTQYGLMRDDYSEKPMFGAYRDLVAQLTVRGGLGTPGVAPRPRLRLSVRCRGHHWRATVGGPDVGLVRRADFRVGNRRARPDRRPPFVGKITARRLDRPRHVHQLRARALLADGRTRGLRGPARPCPG
jgi:hypothetical protein